MQQDLGLGAVRRHQGGVRTSAEVARQDRRQTCSAIMASETHSEYLMGSLARGVRGVVVEDDGGGVGAERSAVVVSSHMGRPGEGPQGGGESGSIESGSIESGSIESGSGGGAEMDSMTGVPGGQPMG